MDLRQPLTDILRGRNFSSHARTEQENPFRFRLCRVLVLSIMPLEDFVSLYPANSRVVFTSWLSVLQENVYPFHGFFQVEISFILKTPLSVFNSFLPLSDPPLFFQFSVLSSSTRCPFKNPSCQPYQTQFAEVHPPSPTYLPPPCGERFPAPPSFSHFPPSLRQEIHPNRYLSPYPPFFPPQKAFWSSNPFVTSRSPPPSRERSSGTTASLAPPFPEEALLRLSPFTMTRQRPNLSRNYKFS